MDSQPALPFELIGPTAPGATKPGAAASIDGPVGLVAQVALELSVPHLDRLFDYLVPDKLATQIAVGQKVRLRFAGKLVSGYVIGLTDRSSFTGKLASIGKIICPIALLREEIWRLAQVLSAETCYPVADVLRWAIPPRHARAEAAFLDQMVKPVSAWPDIDDSPWQDFYGGTGFLQRLASGQSPRAVWQALPEAGEMHTVVQAIVGACVATAHSGRQALVVVPTKRWVQRISEAMTAALGVQSVAVLTSQLGPAPRYTEFLRAHSGQAQVVVGTRGAVFSPQANLGLLVCFDGGDPLLTQESKPYFNAVQALVARADLNGAGVLFGAFTRSLQCEALLQRQWAKPLLASRDVTRVRVAKVDIHTEADLAWEGEGGRARLSPLAYDLVRTGLTTGPVLVQVPSAGYVPVLACTNCGAIARCPHCHGRLEIDSAKRVKCAWCARVLVRPVCVQCAGFGLRARRVGSLRTAHELGRAFPQVPVVVSDADTGVIDYLDAQKRLVIATPGAEPWVQGGYTGALLLDGEVTSGRPELQAPWQALRKWQGAVALVKPEGRVLLTGNPDPQAAQALVRWDSPGFAARNLQEYAQLGFTPAAKMVSLWGEEKDIMSFIELLNLQQVSVLGPVAQKEQQVRMILRCDLSTATRLLKEVKTALAQFSARKLGQVQVKVDPPDL